MNLKEHLQFLAMLLPTLLVAAALFLSLAVAARDLSRDGAAPPAASEAVAVQQTEIGPVQTVVVLPQ